MPSELAAAGRRPVGGESVRDRPVVLLAPDKFKGSLTAAEIAAAIGAGIRRTCPSAELRALPLADGGDGSVEAAVAAGFVSRRIGVTGPTGAPVTTTIALRGEIAVVEVADICGLRRLPGGRLTPLDATSRGVGEALLAAVREHGATTVVLCLGGSATTDGGAGMLTALGVRLADDAGADLRQGGGALVGLATTDASGLAAEVEGLQLVIASDVDSPLLGPLGAAAVFGPQKGATPHDVALLDAGLGRLVEVLGRDVAAVAEAAAATPGAGAAGGLGFAGILLGGRVVSGADYFLDLLGFDAALDGAELVVTGEGRVDTQTLSGKLPAVVTGRARARGVPVVAVAGANALTPEEADGAGFGGIMAISDRVAGTADDPELTRALLEEIGEEIAERFVGVVVAAE